MQEDLKKELDTLYQYGKEILNLLENDISELESNIAEKEKINKKYEIMKKNIENLLKDWGKYYEWNYNKRKNKRFERYIR